jgi:preprotein translocase subunit Sss1
VNPKLMKFLVKQSLGLAVAGLIGYTIKLERKIDDKIDEHFDS